MDRSRVLACTLAAALGASALACAKRPVLYPNPYLAQVGREAADAEIEACLALAESEVGSGRAKEVAGKTVGGAVVGGAVGAAAGAVLSSAGRGAGAGAAAGAAGGLVGGLLGSNEPDPIERAFVDRCLHERGFEPIGWK